MFGYVVPNQAALSDEAQKRYRTAYCGLCRRIDALHGLRGRFTLSYDLTFLNLLLCSLYEGETEASSGHDRCPIHPLGGVEWRAASPTDYCADLSVALHYYNAEDKWKDDRSLLGLGYAAGKAGKTKRSGGKKAASDRPKMASLFKTMSPESLTLEDALKLLSLPREVGSYDEANAETGEMQTVTVMANNGRYGPYLTKTGADGKSDTRSLASEDEIFTVDLEKAKELFAQPKYGRGRGRGAAKPPLRDLGTDPETQKHVTIKDGFYGAYITDGETNRTLPKQYAPESIEPAEAFRLLAEKRAQGPSKRRGRKTAAKGAKKGAAKGAKSAKKVSATEQARADRRAKVRELADKGWANTRIAKEIGSTASTVKADVDWLTANEGYARPEVVPAR